MFTPMTSFVTRTSLFTVALTVFFRPVPVAAQENKAFGTYTNPGAALIGIFYDTKQTQKGAPLADQYLQTYEDFVATGWDERFLTRFFRGTRPVYATQVFIPNMQSNTAPKIFGLEKVVKEKRWFVIYKGQVSPPEDGTYRFTGVADDVMAVAVNGKTTLMAVYGGSIGQHFKGWEEPEPDNPNVQTQEGKLRHGNWFECKKDEIIDLDILVGEYPGSLFGAWLFIEKKGVTYPTVNNPRYGPQPVLPVFQVTAQKISPDGMPVPFTTDSPPWTCHQ